MGVLRGIQFDEPDEQKTTSGKSTGNFADPLHLAAEKSNPWVKWILGILGVLGASAAIFFSTQSGKVDTKTDSTGTKVPPNTEKIDKKIDKEPLTRVDKEPLTREGADSLRKAIESKAQEISRVRPARYLQPIKPIKYSVSQAPIAKYHEQYGDKIETQYYVQPDGNIFTVKWDIKGGVDSTSAASALAELESMLAGITASSMGEKGGTAPPKVYFHNIEKTGEDSLLYRPEKLNDAIYYTPQLVKQMMDYMVGQSLVPSSGPPIIKYVPLLVLDPQGKIIYFTVINNLNNPPSIVPGEFPEIRKMIEKYGRLETALNDSKLDMLLSSMKGGNKRLANNTGIDFTYKDVVRSFSKDRKIAALKEKTPVDTKGSPSKIKTS